MRFMLEWSRLFRIRAETLLPCCMYMKTRVLDHFNGDSNPNDKYDLSERAL